ncbi:MAG TPA: twin-arginine translocase TatA/TatE family subunit [Ignavibacteria bacterium]|nr:twin-arginine translocase TatA/TatE family subunit [Ignavibacteria bacterium]
MFGLGTPEIILIAIVILVLFGAKKIPELMQGLGKGVKEFKKATNEIEQDIKNSDKKVEQQTEQNPTTPK